MARGHEVQIGADGRAFNQALKADIIKPTEQAAKALDDLGDEGEKSGRKLEDALKDASRATDKLDRSMEQVGDSSKKGFRDASQSVDDFKSEAVQNFSEVASSFSGDITQMADGVQGLTGGLASALTPGVGIPIAILGAAAGAFLQSWIQASEDSKERISDMYDDMLDSGSRFLSEDYLNKALGELGQDAGKLAEARERAAAAGAEESTVLRAMVGDHEAIGRLLGDGLAKHRDQVAEIRNSNRDEREKADLIDAANVKYQASIDWLKQIQKDTGTAASQWQLVDDALFDTRESIKGVYDDTIKFRSALAGEIVIPIRVDQGPITSAQNALNNLRRDALNGVTVNMKTVNGRQLLP